MKRKLAGLLLVVIGTILFLDELWFFVPGIVPHGWLIGDWSMFHVYPFHHWMLGVVMIVVGIWLLKRPHVGASPVVSGPEQHGENQGLSSRMECSRPVPILLGL